MNNAGLTLKKTLTLGMQEITKKNLQEVGISEYLIEKICCGRQRLYNSESVEVTGIPSVRWIMGVCLSDLGLDPSEISEIQGLLAPYGLECNPNIRWIPQRVLTIKMQQLLGCHLTDIDIDIRTAEVLEQHKGICCLLDLLNTRWDDLVKCTLPERKGGIPNFGEKALEEIKDCLDRHGFLPPKGTEFVNEQDTSEYIMNEMCRFYPRVIS